MGRIDRNSGYVTLPWYQNFCISTNCGPANMAEKRKKKKTCMTSPCMIALRIKIVAHTFLPLCDNANGRLCQERLWRSVQKFCYHGNVRSHSSSILGDKSSATYFVKGKKMHLKYHLRP